MTFNEKMIALLHESGNLLQSQGLAAANEALRNLQAMPTPVGFPGGVPTGHLAPIAAGNDSARASAQDVMTDAAQNPVQEAVILQAGQFVSGSITNPAGTREYKLYVPSTYTGQALPLIVMLHGCSQDPDDFATGTDMNVHAEEQPCLVLYPAQSLSANGTRCWNWFRAENQQRDQGEASIIADMTRHVIKTYQANPAEVYVAGLSAGGAMAIIMGTAYPDLFAAVGIHSGLPYASAQDLSSAMAAMQNGATENDLAALSADHASARERLEAIPVIVFHGDRDTTVNPRNSHQIMFQTTGLTDDMIADVSSLSTIEQGRVPNGHAYTRTVHHDQEGEAIAEQWLVHGAGHAWSGGNRLGSFTDGKGPSATKEMMRFFSTNARPVPGTP